MNLIDRILVALTLAARPCRCGSHDLLFTVENVKGISESYERKNVTCGACNHRGPSSSFWYRDAVRYWNKEIKPTPPLKLNKIPSVRVVKSKEE